MSNEFPKLSEVFTLDKAVSYQETIEKVWLPQDNAMVSVPSVSPIDTIELVGNTITPRTALVQITYNTYLTDKILHFIDYSNLRDGAILHIRIQDDTFPITIKNGVVGNGGILTADGSDITLDDYRKVVQFQREGSIWRQVGGVQTKADDKTIARTEDNTFEVFGIKDQGVDATAKKIWTGSKEQYDAIITKDPTVIYGVQGGGIYLGDVPLTSGGLEIGDIGFAPLGIDETQNKRRYLNGQVISQTQFATFADKVKAAVALYPSLSATEENWQAEVTNSPYGICGKFVIDDTAGTIRLPKYPDWSIREVGEVPVVGNGLTLGLQQGSNNAGAMVTGSGLDYRNDVYGKPTNTGSYGAVNFATASFGITTDPTKSGMIADLVNANTEDKLQGKWFIQVATGSEESVDVSTEIQLNNPFFFGMHIWSDTAISNASWLISNGSYHSGATYADFYEWLLKIHNGTLTVDGVSVKAYGASGITDYDYVINTADTTFRLPIKVKLASGNAVVGNGMTLGLTNGTDKFGLAGGVTAGGSQRYVLATSNGYGNNIGTQTPAKVSGTNDLLVGITTDPTKSGIETSSSGLKLYFYVGETIQDANVINAAGVLTRVSNSIDRTVASDRETVVGWGMPDYSAEVVQVWNTEYTATEDRNVTVTSGDYNGSRSYFSINGIDYAVGFFSSNAGTSMNTTNFLIKKGTKYKAHGGYSNQSIKYQPLTGVN